MKLPISYTNTRSATATLLQQIEKHLEKSYARHRNPSSFPEDKYPLKVFMAYAYSDISLKDELKKHLSSLCKTGLIELWEEAAMLPGEDISQFMLDHATEADIFLPLISSDFIDSDTLTDHMQSIEKCTIIPIYLRPCELGTLKFAKLKGLPGDPRKPVTKYKNPDEAFYKVALGLRKLLNI